MPKVPALTSRKIIQILKRAGFVEDRQKGSHLIMFNPITKARTVIPIHGRKNIKKSLLHGIISDTKMTTSEFLKLL